MIRIVHAEQIINRWLCVSERDVRSVHTMHTPMARLPSVGIFVVVYQLGRVVDTPMPIAQMFATARLPSVGFLVVVYQLGRVVDAPVHSAAAVFARTAAARLHVADDLNTIGTSALVGRRYMSSATII